MDKIVMTGMQFFGYHGVFPEENKLGQRYQVDVELHLPLDKPGSSDCIDDTVNYAEAYGIIKTIVEQEVYKLIEALAERIASELLQTYTSINEITVRVLKPHPPVAMFFDGVLVEIHRKRA
ncbi:dihydroneopterin aldolase [Paenibacillus radicis (ex Xue et al. 2023)]|uniref:7,8-dihydroneopterin aldolase n=1 Tax=Paenibacillus radicis (ex Xue et al. 2023) TaxID=2972489 RepID=A0ABT1YSI3_9BACL|nr:dihydroneopterin aldolase [Paenibacillus radicis (ex Xue et al. 2023)]MCR8636136.1 dihydroneopterin aldolase [Paenibacillus radicis (ex Xue et al. 2023)]